MNNTDKKHLRHQSNLLDKLLNNYHTRKSAIDFLDRDNFHYLVTIPLKSRFHRNGFSSNITNKIQTCNRL